MNQQGALFFIRIGAILALSFLLHSTVAQGPADLEICQRAADGDNEATLMIQYLDMGPCCTTPMNQMDEILCLIKNVVGMCPLNADLEFNTYEQLVATLNYDVERWHPCYDQTVGTLNDYIRDGTEKLGDVPT